MTALSVAILSVAEKLHSVKNGNRTYMPCRMSESSWKTFAGFKQHSTDISSSQRLHSRWFRTWQERKEHSRKFSKNRHHIPLSPCLFDFCLLKFIWVKALMQISVRARLKFISWCPLNANKMFVEQFEWWKRAHCHSWNWFFELAKLSGWLALVSPQPSGND